MIKEQINGIFYKITFEQSVFNKMGNSNQSRSFLQKGEGLRILSIKLNSPFDGKVQPFFDFIIDVIELQPQRAPSEILDKLTSDKETLVNKRVRDFNEIIEANEQRKLEIKIVSTKLRNVRSILITPGRNWNGKKDLIGITVRKERYDEVFDTYFPVADIQINSPIHLSGVKEGEYLLGCMEFQYTSMDKFVQGLYDRFFDKEVTDKRVNLALYDMIDDQVNIKPVLLRRDWGGKGLLGCQFLQGYVFKFPNNLKEKRQELLQQKKSLDQKAKIKQELKQGDAASKTLSVALLNRRHKLGKHAKNLKNIISELPLPQAFKPQQLQASFQQQISQDSHENNHARTSFNEAIIHQQSVRIEYLQRRVGNLEETLSSMRDFLEKIEQQQAANEKKQTGAQQNEPAQ